MYLHLKGDIWDSIATAVSSFPTRKRAGSYHSGNIYSMESDKIGSYSSDRIFDVNGREVAYFTGEDGGAAASFVLWRKRFQEG